MESKSFPALLIMVFMKIITVLTYPLSNWLPFPPSVPSYSPSLPPSFLPSTPPLPSFCLEFSPTDKRFSCLKYETFASESKQIFDLSLEFSTHCQGPPWLG